VVLIYFVVFIGGGINFLSVYDENGWYVTLIASSVGTRITKSRVIRARIKSARSASAAAGHAK